MKPDFAFFICLGLLLAVAVISASHYVTRNLWRFCPRCKRWHSKLGILPKGKCPPACAPQDYLNLTPCELCKT
jgi:hypothetical protein